MQNDYSPFLRDEMDDFKICIWAWKYKLSHIHILCYIKYNKLSFENIKTGLPLHVLFLIRPSLLGFYEKQRLFGIWNQQVL